MSRLQSMLLAALLLTIAAPARATADVLGKSMAEWTNNPHR